jgi:hypothetical protein
MAERSRENRDQFCSLSIFHQLAVIPASLADGSAWLVLSESDDQPSKVVIAAPGESSEVIGLVESWEILMAILNTLTVRHKERVLLMI